MEEIKKPACRQGRQKQNIRDTVLVQCGKLDLKTLAKSAVELISKEKNFIDAKIVFAYKPFGHEIPFMNRLVEQFPGKEYYFPKMKGKNMHFEHEQPDIVFVPAIAVDKDGDRLGRGWGCYDRFLSQMFQGSPGTFASMCVVPECAVVDNIPTESHDIAVNKIIICKQ